MTRVHLRLVAVAASLVVGVFALPTAAHAAVPPARGATASGPIRIMLEGDSITQGFNGDFTWRYRLDRELRRQGVAFDFVGPRNRPNLKPGYRSSSYADPRFDTDHFAQGGSSIWWHSTQVAEVVREQRPDVIVFAAGVNDLRNGSTPAVVDSNLRRWITKVRSAAPTATIVISPVLDAIDATRPWLGERIRAFRQLEATTVAELDAPQARVVLADTNRGWSATKLTTDLLHPNATGETLIAQRIGETLNRLGILPRTPAIYRYTPWTWQARRQVRVLGRSIRITWDDQALSGIGVLLRRVAPGARARVVRRYYTDSYRTPALVPGATYDVRTQFFRFQTATTYGPVVRVRIPRVRRPGAPAQVVVTAGGVRWTSSPSATRYVVRYRTGTRTAWVTRRTTGLAIGVAGVRVAKVKAVNAKGSSAYRTARRTV